MTKSNNIVYTSPPITGLEILSCSGDKVFDRHLHDGYVVWLNSSGGEKYSVKGNSDILQPGSVGIVEPGVIHANGPCDCAKRHLRSFYLEESFFSPEYTPLVCSAGAYTSLPTIVLSNRRLWTALTELHDLLLSGYDQCALEEQVVTVFSSLMEQCGSSVDRVSVQGRDHRLQLVVDYFHSTLGEKISLDELARLAQCSSYHLIRLFRQHYGLTPFGYLGQLRLEYARKLLDQGKTIDQATYQSGFADQSHMTRAFKTRYGLPPGKYIRQRID